MREPYVARERELVANVRFAATRSRSIDRDDQTLVAACFGTMNQFLGESSLFEEVQLKERQSRGAAKQVPQVFQRGGR